MIGISAVFSSGSGIKPIGCGSAFGELLFWGGFESSPLDDDKIITAFRDGQVTLRENRRSEGYTFAVKEVGYQHIQKGDLVIHTMDAFAGAIGVSDSDGKSTGEYTVCEAIGDDVNNDYYAQSAAFLLPRE
jgi:hypothetical protein